MHSKTCDIANMELVSTNIPLNKLIDGISSIKKCTIVYSKLSNNHGKIYKTCVMLPSTTVHVGILSGYQFPILQCSMFCAKFPYLVQEL